MAMDPATVMKRWARNTQANIDKYKASVSAVQESPGKLAADHIDDYVAGVMEAYQSGRTKAAMQAVELGAWQQATSGRGASNLSTAVGDQQVQNKMQAALSVILPFTENVKQTVRRMPRGTRAQRKARMDKAYEMMSQLQVKPR